MAWRPKFPQWIESRRRKIRDTLHLVVPSAFLFLAVLLRVADIAAVEQIQNSVFDFYNRMAPRPYLEAPVRVIDIDDESLDRLGQWPWPRTLVAELVTRLRQAGASAVAFDIVFAEPDRTSPKQIIPLWAKAAGASAVPQIALGVPDHDQLLASAVAKAPVVLGSVLVNENQKAPAVKASFAVSGQDPKDFIPEFGGAVVNLPILEKAARGNGVFNTISDTDGVIRRVPLIFRVGDELVPSLAAEALRLSQGAASISIKSSGGSGETSFGAHTGIVKVKIGSLVIPTDANGRVWVYYTAPHAQRAIPVWQVLEKGFDRERLKGAIAIIGTSAAGLKDQRPTPLNPVAPGVEIHAQIMEQAYLQEFLERPDWATGAEVVFLILFGSALIVLLKRLGAGWGAWAAAGGVAFALGLSWHAYTSWRWVFDPVIPSLVVLLIYLSSSLISYLRSEGERRQVRSAFGRYLSPVLVEQLAAHPEKLKLGGEKRVMTFHFCDVQGFTTMSEWFDPEGLTRFLNRFLTPMTDIILSNKGSVDKYIGDCIVAYWNAPLDDPDHARHACLSVLDMHARLKQLNDDFRAEADASGKKFVELRVRTGLNTGECIVGNMGSDQRFDYSVLGDDVNLASRLEGANKFFGTYTMISERTRTGAGDAVVARELGRVRVVGKSAPVRVYNLLSKAGELSESWVKALPVYNDGVALYNKRDFAAALERFSEVLKLVPEDGPSKLYATLCGDYAAIPPPDDWDGVFNLTHK